MKKTLIIYGSLRRGEYNNKRFDMDNKAKFLGRGKLSGYKLFSLGMYPCIYPTKESKKEVVVDVFKVPDDMDRYIYSMEVGAGYKPKEVEVITDDGKKVSGVVYVYTSKPDDSQEISHGDWCKCDR